MTYVNATRLTIDKKERKKKILLLDAYETKRWSYY